MPRAKQRTPELRDRLLSVAVQTLTEEGVTGFTTRNVAAKARTSTPAVYELFGDRAGLVREVYFEGFRLLRAHFDRLAATDDPRADLLALAAAFREFLCGNPVLSQVMYARPFADFDPTPSELRASASVREFVVERVARCVRAGALTGDVTDIAHAFVALVQGLAAAENAGRLGTSAGSVERRWTLALRALLDGLR
ncbi:TetR/AcrR family transcriptional regulator [Thermomonospora umbrina]|uniref:TetR family transcriptional regulator n=1 Tax=Thermomonospora umbrina TaxID=111806 RepID=A0A3D9SM68_9ACTN|nr:TetR/AcrR family transcriptional regulator [Thermomonospora umbrina]REE96827.1 TetR family transcriptional regulator [Thermomonospora umbrina]